MRQIVSDFIGYKDIIFDLDGVITQEERYWDAAALAVFEALCIKEKKPCSVSLMYDRMADIRKQIFFNDKLLCLMKARGVNANCDLAYVTFCLLLPRGVEGSEELFFEIEQAPHMTAFALYEEGARRAAEALSLSEKSCMRGGSLWQDFCDFYNTWLLGSDIFRERFKKEPFGEDKQPLLLTEEPLLAPKLLKETLQALSRAGIRLGVATGRLRADCMHPLTTAGVLSLFDPNGFITYDDVLLAEQQTGASLTKPSPWMFQKALFGSDFPDARILSEDYDKERIQTTLIVGDAGADMAAAIAMGADFCAVLTGAHGKNGRPLFEKDARFILNDVSFITEDI